MAGKGVHHYLHYLEMGWLQHDYHPGRHSGNPYRDVRICFSGRSELLAAAQIAIKPILLFTTITSTIGTLQLFDEPYILTQGGPNYATITLGEYLYDNGFKFLKFGFASALGYVMVIIIGILSYIQFRMNKED